MVVTSLSRRIVNRGFGLLVAFAATAFAAEAQATIVALYYEPTVSGGSFVNPSEVMDTNDRVSVAPDRMSFSVSGDFSVLADGSSSTVEVSIFTALLTPYLQNSFAVNTSIDGRFAYIPSGSEPAPTLTTFAATSDLLDIGGTATVSLPPSPLTLSTAPNFPTGGLELAGSASNIATIPPGVVYQGYLQQTTTIIFNNVAAGETLQISLPITTSLTTVPEPGSFTLLLIGGVVTTAGAVWRRKRGHAAGRILRVREEDVQAENA
jgi:PEP-CTERM motif